MEFESDLTFSLFTVLDVVSLSQVCFAIFPMDKNIEQRICLKFCIANGISCAESLKMLQKAYRKSTLSKTRAYEWYSALKSGRDVLRRELESIPKFHNFHNAYHARSFGWINNSLCFIDQFPVPFWQNVYVKTRLLSEGGKWGKGCRELGGKHLTQALKNRKPLYCNLQWIGPKWRQTKPKTDWNSRLNKIA